MVALRDYLATRRTIPANQLTEPAPDAASLHAMLEIASRVPDHGKLAPWRFILFQGAVRDELGERFASIAGHLEEGGRRTKELTRLTRSPLVVAVVSTAAEHDKIPVWEQQLTAGAVCLNLMHAARAHGFSAQWLTEWIAYDAEAKALMGVADHENVAGFIHIGTPATTPSERPRPVVADLVTHFAMPADSPV